MSSKKPLSDRQQVKEAAEIFMQKLASYENVYPADTSNISNCLFDVTSFNLDDLVVLMQALVCIVDVVEKQ